MAMRPRQRLRRIHDRCTGREAAYSGDQMVSALAYLVLIAAALGLGWLWLTERRRAAAQANLAAVLAGHARDDTPFELLQQAGGGWVELASGGDTKTRGTFANMKSCPCRMTYTCATKSIALNAWPNPNPNPVAGFPWNAPPRKAEPWPCPGTCVVVPIKIWRNWSVVQNANGNIVIHIHTLTQYHCKLPDDPDINKPPEGWQLPPKPGEIEP